MTGLINARGIEFDPRDKNLWITDYNGSIYKIAGFDLVLGVNREVISKGNSSKELEFRAYPNPAVSMIIFSMQPYEDLSNVKLEIHNSLGCIIEEASFDVIAKGEAKVLTFDTSKLNSGMYFVVISSGGKNLVYEKIIVIK
jgi:hypothetical protein